MTPQLDLNDLANILFENACTDFHKTKRYKLLQEKQAKMEEDCKTILNSSDFEFVQDCFEILLYCESEEMEFVYRQGFKDCVKILKKLEIL